MAACTMYTSQEAENVQECYTGLPGKIIVKRIEQAYVPGYALYKCYILLLLLLLFLLLLLLLLCYNEIW